MDSSKTTRLERSRVGTQGTVLAEPSLPAILANTADMQQSCPGPCTSVHLPAEYHCGALSVPSQATLSRIQLFVTLGTVACQSPLSMGFSRQEYWSGLPHSASGDLPDPGIKPLYPMAPALQLNSLPLASPGKHSNLQGTGIRRWGLWEVCRS